MPPLSPHDQRITINGKRWRLVYGNPGGKKIGTCENPDKRHKAIVINGSLKSHPRQLLRALIHEAIHAAAWFADEDYVDWVSDDIARLLYSQGFDLQRGEK